MYIRGYFFYSHKVGKSRFRALKEQGLHEAVVAYPSTDLGPYQASEHVLGHRSKPTAVVCCAARGATALLQYADRNIRQVPREFAVSVFGRNEGMIPREWPVTVFPAPVEKFGRAAAETAFKLIQKEPAEDVALPPDSPIVICQDG